MDLISEEDGDALEEGEGKAVRGDSVPGVHVDDDNLEGEDAYEDEEEHEDEDEWDDEVEDDLCGEAPDGTELPPIVQHRVFANAKPHRRSHIQSIQETFQERTMQEALDTDVEESDEALTSDSGGEGSGTGPSPQGHGAGGPLFEELDGVEYRDPGQAVVVQSDSKEGLFKFRCYLPVAGLNGDRGRSREAVPTKDYTEYVEDARGYQWRLLYFAQGNNLDRTHPSAFSAYLEINHQANQEHGQYCRRYVHFEFKALNRAGGEHHVMADDHEFTAQSADWGYARYLSHEKLRDEPGLALHGFMLLEVTLRDLPGVVNTHYYNSKVETGMVGLRNQGATCYINSLLQSLWHISALRKAVYDMPTETEDESSVALALQRIFYKLQTSDKAVATKELTKAFGWTEYDVYQQHDATELHYILNDILEKKMQGTELDGTIKKLYEGETRMALRCTNVDYSSERSENFYDLKLDVEGCHSLYDSFGKYIEPDMLEGDNQYEAEGYGKQDAYKGVRFSRFPPVLALHLKRFEMEVDTQRTKKVHQRYEFPTQINLRPYMTEEQGGLPCRIQRRTGSGEDGDAKEEERNSDGKEAMDVSGEHDEMYVLHSILVHSGDVHAGHYYSYVRRPPPDDTSGLWLKYDDETVTLVKEEDALQDSYGFKAESTPGVGEGTADGPTHGPRKGGRATAAFSLTRLTQASSSAYMLVYIRESQRGELLRQLTDQDISGHLRQRFIREKEEEDRRKKEEAERKFFVNIELVTEADVRAFHDIEEARDFAPLRPGRTGNGVHHQPYGVLPDGVLPIVRIHKEHRLAELLLEVRMKLGIPLHRMRLWTMTTRVNKTIRVDQPVVFVDPEDAVGHVQDSPAKQDKLMFLASPADDLRQLDQPTCCTHMYVEELSPRSSAAVRPVQVVGEDEQEEREEDVGSKRPADSELEQDEPRAKAAKVGEAVGHAGHGDAGAGETAAEAEKLVTDVDGLMAYLEKFPPPPVSQEAVLLFFKAFVPSQDPPLKYLFSAHVHRSLTVRQMLAELRPRLAAAEPEVLGLAVDARDFELHEEITPLKLTHMKMDARLDEMEIQTGDVICVQRVDPVPEPDNAYYYTNRTPRHVTDYFRYCVTRMTVIFKPYSSLEEALLQECLSYIELNRLECEGRAGVVRDNAGRATELSLCVGRLWSYCDFQEAVGSFLADHLNSCERLRFHNRDYHDDTLTTSIGNKKLLPNYHMLPSDRPDQHGYYGLNFNHVPKAPPHGWPTLFFEVLPFTVHQLQQGCVRDLIISDARLRRSPSVLFGTVAAEMTAPDMDAACPHVAKQKELGMDMEKSACGARDDQEPPMMNGVVHASKTRPPAWVQVSPTAIWLEWVDDEEPLVLSVMLSPEASVQHLVETVRGVLGVVRGEGAERLRLLLVVEGKIVSVMPEDGHVGHLLDSPCPPYGVRRKLVLDWVDPEEQELEAAGELVCTRPAGAAQGDAPRAEPTDLMAAAARPVPWAHMQVAFMSLLPSDIPPPADHGRVTLPPGSAVSTPVATYVKSTDTPVSLLERVAAKLGQSVDTLWGWRPHVAPLANLKGGLVTALSALHEQDVGKSDAAVSHDVVGLRGEEGRLWKWVMETGLPEPPVASPYYGNSFFSSRMDTPTPWSCAPVLIFLAADAAAIGGRVSREGDARRMGGMNRRGTQRRQEAGLRINNA